MMKDLPQDSYEYENRFYKEEASRLKIENRILKETIKNLKRKLAISKTNMKVT